MAQLQNGRPPRLPGNSGRGEILPRNLSRRIFYFEPPTAQALRRSAVLLAMHGFLISCALFVLMLSGCTRQPLTKAELRAVTSEIVSATQKVTGRKAEITIRPEADRSTSTPAQTSADNIYITLTTPSETPALEDALANVARRHDLRLLATASGTEVRFDFVLKGVRTHTIHIVQPVSSATPAVTPQPPVPVPRPGGTGNLAIILDDLGYDRASADSLFALQFPLTVSVIPHLPLSTDVADQAYRRGYEVLLHLPMESEYASVKHEDIELRVGMTSQQVESTLAGMLDTVPHAAGVNNHQGSLATADAALMNELMPALRQRDLFFIDSRTTPDTVAFKTAERCGVRAASRRVFLDDDPTKPAIEAQLDLAARDALRHGSAIAIGHPHPATIAALADTLPQLESRGIHLVFASTVVN